MNYQLFDWQCYNYDLFLVPGIGFLRGPDPRPLKRGEYFTTIGAAQTFGRFVDDPFPAQLSRSLGTKAFNLASSAAAPSFFYSNEQILNYVNESKFCVVQVTAARSCGNSRYNNHKTHKNVFQETRLGEDAPFINENEIYRDLWKAGRVDEAVQLIDESKATWIQEMNTLLHKIHVPTILLWLSERTPEYEPNRKSYPAYAGPFPQYVDREMIDAVRDQASHYVEVVNAEGLPIKFPNRFTGGAGECWFGSSYRDSHGYYPSQEMHDAASSSLIEVTEKNTTLRKTSNNAANQEREKSPHEEMLDYARASASDNTTDETKLHALISVFQFLESFRQANEMAETSCAIIGRPASDLSKLTSFLSKKSRAKKSFYLFDAASVSNGTEALEQIGGASDRMIVWVHGALRTPENFKRCEEVLAHFNLECAIVVEEDIILATPDISKKLSGGAKSALRARNNPSWKTTEIDLMNAGRVPCLVHRLACEFNVDQEQIIREFEQSRKR